MYTVLSKYFFPVYYSYNYLYFLAFAICVCSLSMHGPRSSLLVTKTLHKYELCV